MKKIAVLLNGSIRNDSRVIKIVNSFIHNNALVDLFYLNPSGEDKLIFNNGVRLYGSHKKETLKGKIIRHTCFYNEYLFLVKEVLSKKVKYDFVYANDLPCLKPAVLLKRKLGAKVIYDSHEIYIETLNQFFPKDSTKIKRILYRCTMLVMKILGSWAEKKYLKEIDDFITVGEELKNYFEQKYSYKNIRIVMNCPVKGRIAKPFDYRKEYHLPLNSVIVLYQGVLNTGRGLDLLLKAMRRTSPLIYLVIIGDGVLKKQLEYDSESYNLNNKVFFIETKDPEILQSYTSGGDIGVNLLEAINLSKKFAVPNKLFQYIHAGIPVLGSYSPENDKIFNKYNIGRQTQNQEEEIAINIEKMAKSDLLQYKNELNKASKEYCWENQEKSLLTCIL